MLDTDWIATPINRLAMTGFKHRHCEQMQSICVAIQMGYRIECGMTGRLNINKKTLSLYNHLII